MADGFVQLSPDSSGKKADTSELAVGTNTVERQRIVIADPTTAAALAALLAADPAGTEYGLIVRDIPAALTKGTQGTRGYSTQDLKDAGRTMLSISVLAAASVVAETLLTLTVGHGVGTTNTTNTTTYTVPTGKTLRIQTVRFGVRFATPSTTVTFANATFRLRAVSTGTATATSPIVLQDSMMAASNVPTADSDYVIPDGLELPAGTSFCLTQQASATTLLVDVQLIGFEF